MPSYPPGTLDNDIAPIDSAIINSFRNDFRNTWIDMSYEQEPLDDFLMLLVQPALRPMSDDIRASYQLYLPSSVWEDLPYQPDTKFEMLIRHFEFIQGLFLADQAGATLSWVRVIYYIYFARSLLERNPALEPDLISILGELDAALDIPNPPPEVYTDKFESVVSWLLSQAESIPGYDTNELVIMSVDGVFMHEDHVSENRLELIVQSFNLPHDEYQSQLALVCADESVLDWELVPDPFMMDEPLAPATMTHEQALQYVTALEHVDMLGHPSATDRCPFCWGLYDGSDAHADPEQTHDLTVCQTPCNHLFHRGCLARILEHSSTSCSVCSRELGM
ncbi:hypothetical protein PMIN06_007269 [Paraphaeosphaeria minitans]|uniref:RING-type domain-containing protein n=1 Tax=Paraphaeosphaeria minitans TaxID=565426 RepID=A0A9P6GLT1_9PLEO|nr:hypothetical protein PMIN01_05553 [Paraphaeosphaeria minitans]